MSLSTWQELVCVLFFLCSFHALLHFSLSLVNEQREQKHTAHSSHLSDTCDWLMMSGRKCEKGMRAFASLHYHSFFTLHSLIHHRLTLDLWFAKDNRFLNPKSSYKRILMAPPCRLIPFVLSFVLHSLHSFSSHSTTHYITPDSPSVSKIKEVRPWVNDDWRL